jgi:hypothetical protein
MAQLSKEEIIKKMKEIGWTEYTGNATTAEAREVEITDKIKAAVDITEEQEFTVDKFQYKVMSIMINALEINPPFPEKFTEDDEDYIISFLRKKNIQYLYKIVESRSIVNGLIAPASTIMIIGAIKKY